MTILQKIENFISKRRMELRFHPLLVLSIITFTLTAVLLGIVAWWEFVPDNVVTVINSNSVPVDKTIYNAGDRITYTISYCKTRQLSGKVMRALVDGYRTLYETEYSDLPIGCHTTKVNELVIPSFTPTGTYHLDVNIDYQINPLRVYTVHFQTQSFQVKWK